jgi:DNA-directed RNA polymerase alpha subunit
MEDLSRFLAAAELAMNGVCAQVRSEVEEEAYDKGWLAATEAYKSRFPELTLIYNPKVGNPAMPFGAPIDDLELGVIAFSCLKRSKIDTVGQLIAITNEQLQAMVGMRARVIDQIVETLNEYGYSLTRSLDSYLKEDEEEPGSSPLMPLGMSIDKLEIGVRTRAKLHSNGIYSISKLVERSKKDLLAMDSIGPSTVADAVRALAKYGYSLAEDDSY